MQRPEQLTCDYRILRALRRLIRTVDRHSRRLYREQGLTAPQIVCLQCLAATEGLTLSALARQVALGDSTVNGIVDRLAAKQYLTRIRSESDRRKVMLHITPRGREVVDAAGSVLIERLFGSMNELTDPEQAGMADALERLVGLLENGQSPGSFARYQSTLQSAETVELDTESVRMKNHDSNS